MAQLNPYDFAPSVKQMQPSEISNIFIPDLPRGLNDRTLTGAVHFLVLTAAETFLNQTPTERGIIVAGNDIRPADGENERDSGLGVLLGEGVPAEAIHSRATGVDPVTNFIRARKLFDEHSTNAAVGIVTPATLWGLHRHVAERTMMRDYAGLLVSGLSGERQMAHLSDVRRSRRVARGQNPHWPDLAGAEKRALRAQSRAAILRRSGARYYGAQSA
ncbi:MAG TPA: hypothetical protein VII55_00555 [Candidatus Saccharimonadales bacterium]